MNEEEVFEELYSRVKETMDSLGASYEIIFVDDGSDDSTGKLILEYSKKDHSIIGVLLSRNFGQDNAILAGLKVAEGQDIILMDGDLQDPPEVILDLIREKQKDYDVVYGIKTDRKEGVMIKGMTSMFYQFMFFLSGIRMPRNVGTFSIFSRQVGNAIIQFPESNKFFSGLRFFVGFKQVGVFYERERRVQGKSKSFISLARMAMNAIFSYTIFPMRLAILFASILTILTGFVLLLYIFQAIIGSQTFIDLSLFFEPFTILVLGMILMILIVIAEVVGRIDAQVKKRPEYIVKSIIRNGAVDIGAPFVLH